MRSKSMFWTQWMKKYQMIIIWAVIFLMVPLIYLFVYITGGIKFVYSHTMYIPILLAGIFGGPKLGVLVACVSGILLGPLMPIDVQTGEQQIFMNWFYRLLVFLGIGFISGYGFQKLKISSHKVKLLLSHHPETHIPNTNYLSLLKLNFEPGHFVLTTVLVNNHHNITDVLGMDIYYELLRQVYRDLSDLTQSKVVIQADSDKLWIIYAISNLDDDVQTIVSLLNKHRYVQEIPMYVDFSVGFYVTEHEKLLTALSNFEPSDISARYAQVHNLNYTIYQNDAFQKKSDYELLSMFRLALHSDETYLVFQPKIDLSSNQISGFEALFRWEHPTKGFIAPDNIIPLIEETKLIHTLTDWVLTKTLEQLEILKTLGYRLPISINVSAKNIYDPSFFDRFMRQIQTSNVSVELIRIEITETAIMSDPETSIKVLNQFVQAGIHVELDDFGSGYSSLSHLYRYPFSSVKIDRTFMNEILVNPALKEIVDATIRLSKKLSFSVVAEGVEDVETVDLLKQMDCDFAQGYYFSKPMKQDALIAYLKTH